jgi:hypothetical protein
MGYAGEAYGGVALKSNINVAVGIEPFGKGVVLARIVKAVLSSTL